MMKILKLLILTLSLTFFVSCSDDDENTTPVDQETLIGTWEMIALNVNTDIRGTFGEVPITSSTSSGGENFDYTIVFTETTYTATGSYDVVTTGTVNGIPLDEERETVMDANERGTYEFVDGELVIDGELIDIEEANSELEGVELDSNFEVSLNSNGELVVEQNGEVAILVEGSPLDVEYDSRIVFRKL